MGGNEGAGEVEVAIRRCGGGRRGGKVREKEEMKGAGRNEERGRRISGSSKGSRGNWPGRG